MKQLHGQQLAFLEAMNAVLTALVVAVVLIQYGVADAVAWSAGVAAGLARTVLVRSIRSRSVKTQQAALVSSRQAAMRQVLSVVVPDAHQQALSHDGSLDVEAFRDLVLSGVEAAYAGSEGQEKTTGQDARPRSPEQQRALELLSGYPSPGEAAPFVAELQKLGPQTLWEFVEFVRQARQRLEYGMEPVRGSGPDPILVAHLVNAGLVEECDAPPAAPVLLPGATRFFRLTEHGYQVGRLFGPRATRPRSLAVVDPAPALG